LCAQAGAQFVINDRADVAALLHAGLHLGQEDLPLAAARMLLPDAMIGFSTHNAAQLRAAADQPANYLALGPVFGTASKENPDPVVGIDELRRLRPLSGKPLIAIGGITRANAQAVFAAGADSLAIIGDLYDGVDSVAALRRRCREWLAL
jgi:thiamine-phosphate pyrophosphorylase